MDFVQVGVENGGIDFHSSGIDHGDEQVVVANLATELLFHAIGHSFQGVDGHQWQVGSITDPFGCTHTDTQSCIRARTLAHRHGIELVVVDMGCLHRLTDEIRNFLGMRILSFRLAQSQGAAAVVECHRTNRCGRFQTKYHFSANFIGQK